MRMLYLFISFRITVEPLGTFDVDENTRTIFIVSLTWNNLEDRTMIGFTVVNSLLKLKIIFLS